MGEEIAVENGRISDSRWLVTLTLTFDRVTLHTVMHHSSTSTYIPNFVEIEETFCERTGGRTDVRTDGHFRQMLLGRLGGVDLKTTAVKYNPFGITMQCGLKRKRLTLRTSWQCLRMTGRCEVNVRWHCSDCPRSSRPDIGPMVTAPPSDFNSHAKSMSNWLLLVIIIVFCSRSFMSNCHTANI